MASADFISGSLTKSETDEQFQIKRNKYEFDIKFTLPPPPTGDEADPQQQQQTLRFTEEYSDGHKPGCFDYVNRTDDLEKDLSPNLHFSFHLEMDTNKFECKFWKEYSVHLRLKKLGQDDTRYLKIDVKGNCPCLMEEKNPGINTNVTEGKITEILGTSPVLLFFHQHYSSTCDHPEQFQVTVTEFDVTGATLIPLEIQKLIAHRDCVRQVRPLVGEWLNPCDVTFKCNDDYEIKAHKSILIVRSPVLKNLLTSESSKEAKTGTIKVKDLTCSAVSVLVNFMYTGELYENWTDDPDGTIQGAKKYELQQLSQFFDQLLVSVCTSRNAIKFLKLAKKHGLTNAQQAISTYIDKHFQDIFHSCVDLKPGIGNPSHHHSSMKHSLYNNYSAWN